MESAAGMVEESKVVVALDFGTTFSGFAYALRASPENIFTFYDWPMQAEGGGLPYCKTQTSLLYAHAENASVDPFQLEEWGWPAYVKYKSLNKSVFDVSVPPNSGALSLSGERKQPESYFLTLFKLNLAAEGSSNTARSALPPGMTARRAITDYLRQISRFILQEVQNKFGSHITLEDVEWCLTVPAVWNEHAKKEMRLCAEMAGLVQEQDDDAGSPHPLKLLIEPEAASVYCQMKLTDHEWNKGDKFLVVDCGGGTVDLVLHEKLGSGSSVSVREVQESSGDLCGGYQVDEEFFRFLKRKISCFERFERQYPATVLAFSQEWERMKFAYAGEMKDEHVELPPKLAAMWEDCSTDSLPNDFISYDELLLTNADMKAIFDPVVNKILLLISLRMVADLKSIMVVGGFSASPYLMRRIRETFGGRVAAIVNPPSPGSAVCCGAVTMGIRSDTVVSRISKKSYGIEVAISFVDGVHPESHLIYGDLDDGGRWELCRETFQMFVQKGEEVNIKDCVKKIHRPMRKSQTEVTIKIYSTESANAKFVTDPGMQEEGQFTVTCPSYAELGFRPEIETSMFFGHTDIEVSATGTNFASGKKGLRVKFKRHSIY
ncbi:hypothetical protein KC19_4G212300 [Ceratodon purpureus]|uniref:Uncharacterized protein n=1 Tax=Ceratodon purpureus TaxID=3225 RepID=A0A8T0ID76_CERPU|nr:hypothetical protein KC19_4G212300 [Ceratodon purpureus]